MSVSASLLIHGIVAPTMTPSALFKFYLVGRFFTLPLTPTFKNRATLTMEKISVVRPLSSLLTSPSECLHKHEGPPPSSFDQFSTLPPHRPPTQQLPVAPLAVFFRSPLPQRFFRVPRWVPTRSRSTIFLQPRVLLSSPPPQTQPLREPPLSPPI